jgi:uncharacterized protein with von Willebrand factor type A (vWA) domain
MRKLGMKVRESQCSSCQFKTNCAFGQQYGEKIYDITKVVDPDYAKSVHPDCPHIPALDFVNTMNDATKTLASLFDPANQQTTQALMQQLKKDSARTGDPINTEASDNAEKIAEMEGGQFSSDDNVTDPEENKAKDFVPTTVSSRGRGVGYDVGFTADYYVKMQDKMIETLLRTGVEIFDIGRTLASLLSKQETKLKKDTKEQSESRRTDQMRDMSDVAKAEKIEHAMPDEVFDAKTAKKRLNVNREQKPDGKKHLLYLLVDASGSMRTQFLKNPNAIMSRASLASVLIISLMKKVDSEKGIIYLRYFAGSPGPLIEVRTPDDFKAAMKKIADCEFNGGGTAIGAALACASRDIAQSVGEIKKAEILIITDCDDSLSMRKQDLSGAKLSILDVSGTTDTPNYAGTMNNHAANVLKGIADSYYKADERSLNLKSIVSLI